MTLTVQLFGPYAVAAGRRAVALSFDECPPLEAGQVMAELEVQWPALRPLLPAGRLAVNGRYASTHQPIAEDDELAVIGLVGGG